MDHYKMDTIHLIWLMPLASVAGGLFVSIIFIIAGWGADC